MKFEDASVFLNHLGELSMKTWLTDEEKARIAELATEIEGILRAADERHKSERG